MTLVDTSIWIDHFRSPHPELMRLLEAGEVATHPMVLGELACGQLPKRPMTLDLLQCLPRVPESSADMVLHAIETNHWFGSGIGWVDAHLLAASLLSGAPLLTSDSRLAKLARAMGA
jgi:predicted nucleic acid-binding protein